ncbi:tyrosine-type recombinase/integrase [Actinoplanes sp. RD1]|uniref:tyrosine-type recombinase/integrase n=1 Tax=Actinoplanes sp. RD1 TaxID=3064538 RepID=UPI0035570393
MIALLGLLGLRIFEACGASIADLGEEHGHRVLRVHGKGGKVVLVPLPPAVARAIDRAVGERLNGPILRNTIGARMDRHAATRRLKHLAATAGIRMPKMHPHMLRHTFVTTMLDARVSLRDVQIAARHADPKPPCATTEPVRTSTGTPTTSSLPTWPPAHNNERRTRASESTESRLVRCAEFVRDGQTLLSGATRGRAETYGRRPPRCRHAEGRHGRHLRW